MTKGPIHQEGTAILNVYTPSNRAAIYGKQNLIKLNAEIDKLTIIVEASTLFSQQLRE